MLFGVETVLVPGVLVCAAEHVKDLNLSGEVSLDYILPVRDDSIRRLVVWVVISADFDMLYSI